ncbi:hypothetical protein SLE2022_347200 [Rubroshorea leprosula]
MRKGSRKTKKIYPVSIPGNGIMYISGSESRVQMLFTGGAGRRYHHDSTVSSSLLPEFGFDSNEKTCAKKVRNR